METTSFMIDRPGTDPAMVGEGLPMVEERPGDPSSPVWMVCDIELANGRHLLGAVRITPPQKVFGAPKVARTTGILAIVGEHIVDLFSGSERVRAGLAACDTVPLRFRLREDPPCHIAGFNDEDPRIPLEAWMWTRRLQPVDMADDVAKLAPMPW